MRSDLTDITVVLDRSGSMSSCRTDMEGGLNEFIKKQKELPGEALFTLCQFDNIYEFVHKAIPIANVPHCHLEPRGSTALLDAVGRAVTETGERLKAIPEDQRPGLVVFLIITDGQENASKEFKLTAIKEMIEQQRNDYKWQFTFLGANQDAFAEAAGMGIPIAGVANYNIKTAGVAFAAATRNVGAMRGAVSAGLVPDNAYSDEERKDMETSSK